jgi:predicted ATPase
MPDGRLLLQFKDAPFDEPILSKFASDGTLKMLSYLVVLHDPDPAQFIGIEEPENYLHPRLLPELAEECRRATEHSQLLVATHSPFFVNGARPNEVWALYRDQQGHTQVTRANEVRGLVEFVNAGASIGDLWMEGRMGLGDPLVNAGAPRER